MALESNALKLAYLVKHKTLAILVLAFVLNGCGGGGGGGAGSPASGTLSGVAAVGTPIVNGTVKVICSAGSAPSPTTTSSTGAWSVTLSGQTLPCAVQVSDGTINSIANVTSYHSIALTTGTVNVTPLTDLLVANLAGTSTPATWFAGLGSAPTTLASINQAKVDTALANLNGALPTLPLYVSSTSPITAPFTPVAGNAYDDMLAALQTAMTNASVSYATLLGSAAASGFPAPSGLPAALTTSYQGTASGSNLTYFPVNAPITTFNATTISVTMTGSLNGKTLAYSGTNFLSPANQTFLGQPAGASTTSAAISVNGTPTYTINSTNYFSVAPYKNLGSTAQGAGVYTVFSNQIALPSTATVGSGGSMDTGTDYTDSTQSTIKDTFIDTWSLVAGQIPSTATLCINTVTKAVASSATSGTSNYCLTVDTSGNLLGAQTIGSLEGSIVTLSGTSIIPSPTVTSTSPVNSATGIATNSVITATFNTPIDPASITAVTFTLTSGTTPIDGSVTYDGTTATFTPYANLSPNTLYTATITSIENAAFVAMNANYSWSFHTIEPPDSPTISAVIAGPDSATVNFTAPANNGGSSITGYTVTAIPSTSTLLGNVTATGTTSPILITNLTGGTAYTLTVAATNSIGTGNASAASASVTPTVGSGFYVVSTLAGSFGYSVGAGNSNGTGTDASFNYPTGVAVDSSGNVYVADSRNNLIRKISPTGVVSTLAGSVSLGNTNGTGTTATLFNPTGVAVDSSGNIYVADSNNNEIRKITPAGSVSTLAGGNPGNTNGTGTAATFNNPTGVAVDTNGNIYVADRANNQIRKITPTGLVSTLAGSGSFGNANGSGTSASFAYPVGVAVDTRGNVYVADTGNYEIRKITPAGMVSTLAGGNMGIINGNSTAASFGNIQGVAVDSSGNVYVAESFDIRLITPAGQVSTFSGSSNAGNANGLSALATFYFPSGLTVDSSGNVYVADSGNNNIRKITLVP